MLGTTRRTASTALKRATLSAARLWRRLLDVLRSLCPIAIRPNDRGERAAARYLMRSGWEVLEANVRIGRDEADLLCLDEHAELILVEVKSSAAKDDPVTLMDREKEACLRRLALAIAGEAADGRWSWALRAGRSPRSASPHPPPIHIPRIDLVTVRLSPSGPHADMVLAHYRQAVEAAPRPRGRGVLRR